MSRHSHWAKIKHTKGATDQKKGALFSKISRLLTVAARAGVDPVFNFKLRLTIEQAKTAGMTKETMERAIAKGSGQDKDGLQLAEETYEGFGPGGTALIVEVITDNRNRAYQDLRKVFVDHGGNLGSPGVVAWMFLRRGVIHLPPEIREDLELQLIEAGAEDIVRNNDGLTVYTRPEELKTTEEKIRGQGLIPDYTGLEWVPKEKITTPESEREKLEALQEALDDLEDVSEYYTNATL